MSAALKGSTGLCSSLWVLLLCCLLLMQPLHALLAVPVSSTVCSLLELILWKDSPWNGPELWPFPRELLLQDALLNCIV